MRLYSRVGATTLAHAGRQFAADDGGGFELPEEVAGELRSFPEWETEVDRQIRLHNTELERKRDLASLFDELAGMRTEISGLREDVQFLRAEREKPAPAKKAPAPTAAG